MIAATSAHSKQDQTGLESLSLPASGPTKPAADRPTRAPANSVARQWQPSPGLAVAWLVLGGFLTALGAALFATLYAATHDGLAEFNVRSADLAPVVATSLATVLVLFAMHELIHGMVIRSCGARPRFRINLVARVLPALYTTAPGARFSRHQYAGVSLAPLLVVSIVGALFVVMAPFGGVLVLPLGIHLGGCVGDLWMAGLVMREPRGTLIEDSVDGAIFLPAHGTAHLRATQVGARLPYYVSIALAIVAVIASAASFFFWQIFHRDVPMGVGNMRGTALAMLAIAVPLLIVSMALASRGSLGARFVWLGTLAYIAYNAVLFSFAAHFNSFFLLFAALLALSFWALLTLLRNVDLAALRKAGSQVPARVVAVYMLVTLILFGAMWLRDIIPATIENTMPASFEGTGLTQNPIYVLDFAFTFPLLAIGALWLWQRRAWGYVIGGMMVVMLTVETASIAIDQVFGHIHDPSQSLNAVPIMLSFTGIGVVFSVLFLRGVGSPRIARTAVGPTSRPERSSWGDSDPVAEQHSLIRSVILHLAPGAVFTAFIVLAAPVLASWGVDGVFVLFGGIGFILVPIELGYLALEARRTTGSWSPLRVVNYKQPVSGGRLALLAAGLTIWFLLVLLLSMAFLDGWLARSVFSWLPDTLLQFALVESEQEPVGGGAVVAVLLIALAFNGVAGPITEELYFRGHLLPRLERYGRWAPVINTALFALYHFFSPWRYPAIILGFLPIAWMARRERSVFVSIAAHMTINTITVLLLLAAFLAPGN